MFKKYDNRVAMLSRLYLIITKFRNPNASFEINRIKMSKIIIRAIPYIQDFYMENKQKIDICYF